ncbi:EAL domain-containing protein [Pseudomonas sp. Q1]|uniref:EAL domain-containing protein n=1 Tax=Pseudomonas sp. Q1 TaxID=2202823 RepID=UPI001374F23E|nr:EAL domain-containing protein [Pseudomonas sp. Q1]NCE83784.1 hypothetical protein [Pseudomonas sp. Q1]
MSISSLRIIVLENHSFQRIVTVRLLQRLGCQEVFQAVDGAEALKLLKQVGAVDIVLCDFCIDSTDSLGFLQATGPLRLVRSVILLSSLPTNLRCTVSKIIQLLGLEFLGDIESIAKYETLEQLLKKAVATPGTQNNVQEPIQVLSEARVLQAFAANELCPYFQPKFLLETGEMTGVEILARWQQPDGNVLGPAYFFTGAGALRFDG